MSGAKIGGGDVLLFGLLLSQTVVNFIGAIFLELAGICSSSFAPPNFLHFAPPPTTLPLPQI